MRIWRRAGDDRDSVLDAPVVYGAEPPVLALRVSSYVYEEADAEGAAENFAFLADESSELSPHDGATPVAGGPALVEDIPGTRVIGDESEITQMLGVQPATGLSYRGLDLTFRVENLFAGVGVYDYTGGEPDVATLEALAQTYLEHIEQVLAVGGPGLSNRIVRLESTLLDAVRDDYGRIGGVHISDYNESAEEFAARSARAGDATDVYFVAQRLPSGSAAPGDDVTYQGNIYRFADKAAASYWLNEGEERLAQIGAFVQITVVPDAATIGDESLTFAIDRQVGEQETRGYLIFARVGNEALDLRLFAQPEAPLALVEELAQAQVACLRSEEICEPIPAPADLVALAVLATPVAAGTPVA